MRFEIIKKEDFVVHGWSGGTTAEIFLYPPSSHWEKKDFQIRVSSADCRIDGAPYSDFTGYTRHICPLRGTMQMVHEGHHEIKLNPYEVDIFDGAWLTYHTGIAIDKGLITVLDIVFDTGLDQILNNQGIRRGFDFTAMNLFRHMSSVISKLAQTAQTEPNLSHHKFTTAKYSVFIL